MTIQGFHSHPKYEDMKPLWERCTDAIAGQHRVKHAGHKYLPDISDEPHEHSLKDYQDYIKRALYYNVPGNTALGMFGALTRRGATVEFPESRTQDLNDLGYGGESLDSLVRDTATHCVERGRVGHLVDAKPAQDGTTRPYIAVYNAESILDWSESVFQDRRVASMFLLLEKSCDVETGALTKEGLKRTEVVHFRLLTLETKEDGVVYRQRLYRVQKTDKGTELILELDIVPTRLGGRPLDYIPFRITSSGTTVTLDPVEPPILPVVDIALSSYINSADLEHGSHYTAMPTPIAAGFNLAKGKTLRIGARTAWCSEDAAAHAEMLEFTGAGLASLRSLMTDKKQDMALLGARLFENSNQAESGEALKTRQAGNRSVLATMANNISESWTWLLQAYWDWISLTEVKDISVTLSVDYSTSGLDPNMLNALMSQVMTGYMSWDVYFHQLDLANMYPKGRTREQERELIAEGTPAPAPAPVRSSTLPGSSDDEPPQDNEIEDDEDDEESPAEDA